jgi:acetyl-CoA acyltransferase
MTEALIVDAVRTPIGRRNGALAGVRADELAAQILNGLVGGLDLDPGEIEDVQMGCVSQVGEQALNVARMSLLVAGWPETVCGTSVDRQCGSSMQAAFNAAAAIQAGHLDVVVASGVESMSRVPMGSNLTANGFEGFSPKLYERWEVVPQGISAEVIADEWDLSREALDEYSYESHRRAIAAIDEGARDRPGRGRRRWCRGARGHGREPSPRHLAREARVTPAGVQGGGQDHRRELERDRRRRRRDARRE